MLVMGERMGTDTMGRTWEHEDDCENGHFLLKFGSDFRCSKVSFE